LSDQEGFFDTLKKKNNLAINTSVIDFDEDINLMLRLVLRLWMVVCTVGGVCFNCFTKSCASQDEIGNTKYQPNAGCGRRRTRAKFDLVLD
jgi:hypothetical protein